MAEYWGDSRFLIMFFWCLKVVLLPRVYSEIRRPRAQWPLGRRGEPRFAWGPVFSAVCVASRTLAGGSSQPTPSAPLDVLIRLGRGRSGRRWEAIRARFGQTECHQQCGRCQSSRYLYGQTRALPLSSFDYVFGQNVTELNPACAIALRSPASERPSDLKRYSPDIVIFTYTRILPWAEGCSPSSGMASKTGALITNTVLRQQTCFNRAFISCFHGS